MLNYDFLSLPFHSCLCFSQTLQSSLFFYSHHSLEWDLLGVKISIHPFALFHSDATQDLHPVFL